MLFKHKPARSDGSDLPLYLSIIAVLALVAVGLIALAVRS